MNAAARYRYVTGPLDLIHIVTQVCTRVSRVVEYEIESVLTSLMRINCRVCICMYLQRLLLLTSKCSTIFGKRKLWLILTLAIFNMNIALEICSHGYFVSTHPHVSCITNYKYGAWYIYKKQAKSVTTFKNSLSTQSS